jgi:hypothetical protein
MSMFDRIGDPGSHERKTIDPSLGGAWRPAQPRTPMGAESRRRGSHLGQSQGTEAR